MLSNRKGIFISAALSVRFDALKERFKYSKTTDFISDMLLFFELNAVNLRTQNFKSGLQHLEEVMIKRFNQLQTRITVDISQFNSAEQKFETVNEVFNQLILKNIITDSKQFTENEDTKSDEINKLKKTISEQQDSVRFWDKQYHEELERSRLYKSKLEKLNECIKVETSLTGTKKAVLDLPLNKLDKLFKID